MFSSKKTLRIAQLDQILERFKGLDKAPMPKIGWVRTVRLTLGMSMRQLGERMGITAQAVAQMEERETQGAVTIESLQTAARAMNMKVVYALLPAEGTLESMVEARALELAKEMVALELKDLSPAEKALMQERLEKSILTKALELRAKIPRNFWNI
jgi:predicted DNA-binding mobile mystery protein A